MAGLVDKTYGDALFELFLDEKPSELETARDELAAVSSIISEVPGLIKLAKTPTVEKDEKNAVIEAAFKGKLSEYIYNFLMVLTDAGRLDDLAGICKYFGKRCNDHLGIAEITVVTCQPLTADAKQKLTEKMGGMLGKRILMKEEIDPSILGGIVVKNGNSTLDGSVRARLHALKTDIGSVIC